MNFLEWNELKIFTFFLIFIRVASLFTFLPILGDRYVPMMVKILISLSLAWICFPILWAHGLRVPVYAQNSDWGLVTAIGMEVLFGAVLGFVSRWIFDAVQFAGQFAGASMGFSMPSVLDPSQEVQTVALGELHYILALLLFITMDGHHLYLKTLMDSFHILPLGVEDFFSKNQDVIRFLTQMTAEVLVIGLKLAAPVITVLVIVNITMGIMSRAVPQMNVFVVSFAVNIVVGLFVVLISLPAFSSLVTSLFDSYTPELEKIMKFFARS